MVCDVSGLVRRFRPMALHKFHLTMLVLTLDLQHWASTKNPPPTHTNAHTQKIRKNACPLLFVWQLFLSQVVHRNSDGPTEGEPRLETNIMMTKSRMRYPIRSQCLSVVSFLSLCSVVGDPRTKSVTSFPSMVVVRQKLESFCVSLN